MRKILTFALSVLAICSLKAQYMTHSIEHEFHKVGVFNPQWETEHTLNPKKYEHITAYFREELAKIIFSAVKEKRVKIYDERKRELNLDSVEKKIIDFEKQYSGKILGKDTLWEYIAPFVGAFQFEEFVNYTYQDLALEKKVKAYCPYMVRYRAFTGESNDSVQMPLFWIFPQESQDTARIFHIPDTIISVHPLRYPNQMPFCTSLFELVKQNKIKAFKPEGGEFATLKQIEDLFVIKNEYVYFDEQTQQESIKTAFSDLMPEDIIAIRVGEGWEINPASLEIYKQVYYYLPLYQYDAERFGQLGLRIYNKNYRH